MERLNQVLSELKALSSASSAALAAAAAPPPTAEEQMGLGLRPGARVFDLVTGEVGEVIGGGRANYVVPTPKR